VDGNAAGATRAREAGPIVGRLLREHGVARERGRQRRRDVLLGTGVAGGLQLVAGEALGAHLEQESAGGGGDVGCGAVVVVRHESLSATRTAS